MRCSMSRNHNTKPVDDPSRYIGQRIAEAPGGAVPFSEFMRMCLYDQDAGYYMKEQVKTGKQGDFYTAAHIGSVFGQVLSASILQEAVRLSGEKLLVTEWGGGNGRLALQILDEMRDRYPAVYERLEYWLVEASPFHRKLQLESLQGHLERIFQLEPAQAMDQAPRSGIILSNELLDAFPVRRVRQREEGLMELWVAWEQETDTFRELELPCRDSELDEYFRSSGIRLQPGQTAEIGQEAAEWLAGQAERLDEGSMITIDYGDVAEELFASHRFAGTLMCYKDHNGHDNPYIYPGEQDITAHVDFSACIRAGERSGIQDWSLMTQKEFLMDNGLLELLVEHDARDPFSPASRRNRAIRQLLLTDGMSELFKVLIQRK